MSIKTRSMLYYDFVVSPLNLALDLDDGFGTIQISLSVGSYTLTTLAQEVQRKLLEFGNQSYTVTVDRELRQYTISAPANFELKFVTGPNAAQAASTLLGFSGDQTGSNSYTSTSSIGRVFRPQFFLFRYESTAVMLEANKESINETASGRVESVTFGNIRKMTCNIKYITNLINCNGAVEKNDQGVEDAVSFMEYLVTKRDIEFMEDRNDTSTFETLLLDSTSQSSNGTAYRLKENLPELPDFYETGRLVFRKVVL